MWAQLKRVGRQSAVYGLGNIATALLAFLLLPLYAHQLTLAEFGAYALMSMVIGALAPFTDAGLTNSIARYYFEASEGGSREEHGRRLISTAMLLTALLGVAVALPCYLAATPIARHLFEPYYSRLIRLVALILLVRAFTTAPMVYLRVRERAFAYVGLVIFHMACFIAFNVVLVAKLKWGLVGVLYAQLLATAAWALAAIFSIHRDLGWHFDLRLARELLRFGLPFLPVLIFMWVIDVSDRYILGVLASAQAVGLYSFGYKIGQAMSFVVTAFTLGWGPVRFKILQGRSPELIYSRVADLYVAGAGLLWLAISLLAHDVVRLLAPPSFGPAAAYVAPIAFGYLLYGLFVLAVTGLGVAKRTLGVPAIALLAAVVNVGLNLWLMPAHGAMVAAYSTVAAYFVLALGSFVLSQRLYFIPYEYGRWLFILGGLIAILWLGGLGDQRSWALTVLVRLVALVAGLALVLVSGALRPGELGRLAQLKVWCAAALRGAGLPGLNTHGQGDAEDGGEGNRRP